jgi:hypothetical protein
MKALFANAAFRKGVAALGWLLLFCFLFLGVAGSMRGGAGSIFGAILFGGLTIAWVRLAWKTLKDWFNAGAAIALLFVLALVYFLGLYVAWLGQK